MKTLIVGLKLAFFLIIFYLRFKHVKVQSNPKMALKPGFKLGDDCVCVMLTPHLTLGSSP